MTANELRSARLQHLSLRIGKRRQAKTKPFTDRSQNSGQITGATYQFYDDVEPGKHYYYWLQLVQEMGMS